MERSRETRRPNEIAIAIAIAIAIELAGALLIASIGAPPSSAEGAANTAVDKVGAAFNGRWLLDKDASDPMDLLLEWQGHSWLRRRVARAMSITLEIACDEDTLREKMISSLISRERVFELDDRWHEREDPLGKPVRIRTRRDGDAFVQLSQITLADGSQALVEVRRAVDAGGATMTNHFVAEREDGRRFEARRVFQRAPAD